ncbi:hypothetical protein S245_047540, partial [Arachis hypogaea]
CCSSPQTSSLSLEKKKPLMVAGASTGKNLGLFCFNEDDTQALLSQVSTVNPPMLDGPKHANPNPFSPSSNQHCFCWIRRRRRGRTLLLPLFARAANHLLLVVHGWNLLQLQETKPVQVHRRTKKIPLSPLTL